MKKTEHRYVNLLKLANKDLFLPGASFLHIIELNGPNVFSVDALNKYLEFLLFFNSQGLVQVWPPLEDSIFLLWDSHMDVN